jgi:hypothetical protein
LSEEEKNREESEQESLELDKLQVSAKKAEPESPAVTTETPPKTETPPQTGPSLWKSLVGILISKEFLLSAVAGLVVGSVILFALSSGPPPPQDGVLISDGNGRIVYQISSPLGLGHRVEMKLSVPFKNIDEKKNLIKSLSRLKRELPLATRSPEVLHAINRGDMDALQHQVVKIASNATGLPSEKLELVIESVD